MHVKLTLAAPIALLILLSAKPAEAANGFECLIEPMQSVDISSPVIGLLDKVHVRRGDKVSKGQLLATLESRVEAAATALALYKSEMTAPTKTAQSKIEFSKRNYERRRDMHASNFLPQQERDDAEAEMRLAEAELQQAIEAKQMAKLEWQQQSSQLNLRTIRSPFDGIVVDQLLFPGEVVEPSGQKKSILKLAQLDPLRVRVILPMSKFGQIKLGASAVVHPEAPINGHYTGSVKIIDKVVDAASGTLVVFLEIVNPKFDVPSGVKCRVEFAS